MTDANLMLVAASYADADSAQSDFEALKAAQSTDDFAVVEAVVLTRADDGAVKVAAHNTGMVAGSAVAGSVGGLVVGLFAPPLLLAGALGAGVGAGIGALVKRHEEKKMGVELEEFMPAGTSAVVAVVDDTYTDRVDSALGHAAKKVSKAVDSGDYDSLVKALQKGSDKVEDALES